MEANREMRRSQEGAKGSQEELAERFEKGGIASAYRCPRGLLEAVKRGKLCAFFANFCGGRSAQT